MPILFQYRNIRHLLGMYITKQAEQEIYLIAQKKLGWGPLPLPTRMCKLNWDFTVKHYAFYK